MGKCHEVLHKIREGHDGENEEERPPCARATFNICSCKVLGTSAIHPTETLCAGHIKILVMYTKFKYNCKVDIC